MPSSGTLGGIHKTGDTIKLLVETSRISGRRVIYSYRIDTYRPPAFTRTSSVTLSGTASGRYQYLWSDGTTAYAYDNRVDQVRGWDEATGRRRSTRDIAVTGSGGLWGVGDILYALQVGSAFSTRGSRLLAYSRTRRAAVPARNVTVALGFGFYGASGLWSDETTVWMGNGLTLSAATLATGARNSSKDITVPEPEDDDDEFGGGFGHVNVSDITGDDDDLWVLLNTGTILRIAKPA